MKGATVTLVLIMLITALLTSILVVWASMNAIGFFEVNEINSVKKGLEDCNDKIFETARTGLSNECKFSIERGELKGTTDDISYQIVTHQKVCDQSSWVLIESEKNLWQKCDASSDGNIFSLKWNYTSIKFQFESMGNIEIRGQTGQTIEISRASMSDTQTNILLRIQ